MPTGDYTIEMLEIKVEYEFYEWVESKPYVDVVGEDAYIEIDSITLGGHDIPVETLPASVLADIREHFLAAELAGPDLDKESDRRRDEGEM